MTYGSTHNLVGRTIARLVSSDRPTGPDRTILLVGSVVAILVIALVNGMFDIALRAFYAIPVVVVTVAVSTTAGYLYAAAATLAWTFDRAVSDPVPVLPTSANALLRLVGFVLLVMIVSTLRDAIASARASEQRSREFLAFAAHQLRTPIAGVRACAEALVLTDDSGTRDDLLAGITGEAGRMGRLIAALLRMARLDQGDVLDLVPSDPRVTVAAEVERVRRATPHVSFDVQAYDEGPQHLLVDPEALSEMLANLLDNARRHAVRHVQVGLGYDRGTLRIEVRDDGPGLPPGQEAQAFGRFVSLDGRGGSGLGLPVAQALAEAHGGRLTYEDRRFVISLAAAPAPPGELFRLVPEP